MVKYLAWVSRETSLIHFASRVGMDAAISEVIHFYETRLVKFTSTPEWTILASILEHDTVHDTWSPVTIATGLKCLPECRCQQLQMIDETLSEAALRDMHPSRA